MLIMYKLDFFSNTKSNFSFPKQLNFDTENYIV